MKALYFDCFSGISGDMVLGALVDAGVPFEELKAALESLPVDGYEISVQHVQRCGIGGTQVQVKLTGGDAQGHEHGHHDHEHHHHDHGHHDHHHHDHDSHHGHDHDNHHHHEHDHGHHHHHHHGPHRGFSEIKRIIESSGFSDVVKGRAIEAFRRIAVEESAVHEMPLEEVHFHEVGAVDAIVDIVGAMWCVERLGVTRFMASQVAVGSGTIRVAHGEMPIPAPATARLLKGVPICTGPVSGELTTPTGAAILRVLVEEFGPLDGFKIQKVGYGAGMREYPHHTNYLRVLLGDMARDAGGLPLHREELQVIMTEIDDMPAELLGAALESLMAAGALDCHFVPCQMKKQRPGTSLNVLTTKADAPRLMELIFRETSTFGVRVLPCERLSLRRKEESVSTPFGPIKVKVGYWGNEVLRRTPEFDECRSAAAIHGVTILEVYQAAVGAAAIRK